MVSVHRYSNRPLEITFTVYLQNPLDPVLGAEFVQVVIDTGTSRSVLESALARDNLRVPYLRQITRPVEVWTPRGIEEQTATFPIVAVDLTVLS